MKKIKKIIILFLINSINYGIIQPFVKSKDSIIKYNLEKIMKFDEKIKNLMMFGVILITILIIIVSVIQKNRKYKKNQNFKRQPTPIINLQKRVEPQDIIEEDEIEIKEKREPKDLTKILGEKYKKNLKLAEKQKKIEEDEIEMEEKPRTFNLFNKIFQDLSYENSNHLKIKNSVIITDENFEGDEILKREEKILYESSRIQITSYRKKPDDLDDDNFISYTIYYGITQCGDKYMYSLEYQITKNQLLTISHRTKQGITCSESNDNGYFMLSDLNDGHFKNLLNEISGDHFLVSIKNSIELSSKLFPEYKSSKQKDNQHKTVFKVPLKTPMLNILKGLIIKNNN
jgi:hypothetical protein